MSAIRRGFLGWPRPAPLPEKASNPGRILLCAPKVANGDVDLHFTPSDFSWTDFDEYVFELVGFLPSSNGAGLVLQISQNGGATWVSSASYKYGSVGINSAGTALTTSNVSGTFIAMLAGANGQNNTVGLGCDSRLYMTRPWDSTIKKRFRGQSAFDEATTGAFAGNQFSGEFDSGATNPINGIRFTYSAGNVALGTVRAFGVRAS